MEAKEKEKDLEKVREESKKHSIKEAIFSSASVGAGENYVGAYAVALKASAAEIGLLTSLPNLLAPLAQLITSRIMKKVSRKKICDKGILLQALMWLPMAFLSYLYIKNTSFSPFILIIFYTLYAAFGNFVVPAWSSWIGEFVKKREINGFLGMRNKLGSVSTLIGIITAGIILDVLRRVGAWKGDNNIVFFGFGLIFLSAFLCRLVSRSHILKQHEPEFRFKQESYFSFISFIKEAFHRPYGKFAVYVSLMIFAANIAGPFYTIYMLRDMGFSYLQFMLMQVASTAATFFYMPLWSIFAERYGNIHTMRITGYMIPILCFLWPISIFLPSPFNFYFLIATNFYAGLSWAGFNLSAGSYLYDATSSEKRSLCSAYSNILNGIGVVIGATLGSLIITYSKISFMNVIMFVSIISGIIRLVASFVMIPKLDEVRQIEEKPMWQTTPLLSQILEFQSTFSSYFPFPEIAKIKKNNKINKHV